MPTLTTIALQNLLQHPISGKNSPIPNNPQSSTNKPHYLTNQQQNCEPKEGEKKSRLNHVYISPALYTTPEPTPILDHSSSSGSVSSSPYVFNRKGRGGGKSANRRIDGFEVQLGENGGEGDRIEEDELVESCLFDDDDDDFADPRCDSLSVGSSIDLIDSGRLGFENMSMVSNQIGEFYDATEDFSSDGSMSSIAACIGNLELELQSTKINLHKEIEKRKAAEDDVAAMCAHWHRVSKFLLTHTSNDSSLTTRFDINAVKQLSEEVVVGRFVAEAIGKAEAKDEAELAAQLIITSKDKEISRLRDRLQYYEAMIREMSRNNLESMEVARRHRERRRVQRKWLWSCIGVSVVIGASVIACSYAPHSYPLDNVGDAQPEGAYDIKDLK